MKTRIILIAFSIIILIGCAESGGKKENTSNKIFRSDSLHISFSYPSNWEVETKGDRIGVFENIKGSEDNYQENIIIWTEELPVPISDSLYHQASIGEVKIKNPTLEIIHNQSKKLGEHVFNSFKFEFPNEDSSRYSVYGYTFVNEKRGYNFSCSSISPYNDSSKDYQAIFESILKTIKTL